MEQSDNPAKNKVSKAYQSGSQWVQQKTKQGVQWVQQKTTSAYEKAKQLGQSTYNWGASKLKEAGNIAESWTKSMEKTVKHFCTTANRIKKGAVEFVKDVDWKKVAITVAAVGVSAVAVVATGGLAAGAVTGGILGGLGHGVEQVVNQIKSPSTAGVCFIAGTLVLTAQGKKEIEKCCDKL